MRIADEHAEHEEAVRRVITNAFGRDAEARLVEELRFAGDLTISLVAADAGEICGHVALSRLKAPQRALALAPISVLKAKQRQGIGSALIRRAVELARDGGHDIIFVLGDPDYYKRFGFDAREAALFRSQFRGPHFMALNLLGRPAVPGNVIYPHAFGALD
jgi:putative acetyltransferase